MDPSIIGWIKSKFVKGVVNVLLRDIFQAFDVLYFHEVLDH